MKTNWFRRTSASKANQLVRVPQYLDCKERSTLKAKRTGRCLCGSFQYSFNAEPVVSFNCHCRDCQRATGSVFASIFAVPKDSLTMTGEYRFFTKRGDSGREVSRGFCPECGSRVVSTTEHSPNLYLVYASSLDDPSWHKPAMNSFTASALPWDCMDPDLPKYEQGRPTSG